MHWLLKYRTLGSLSNEDGDDNEDGRIATGLGYVHAISDNFCAGTKTIPDKALFAHKNGDFGAISATERSCAALRRATYFGAV